MQRVVIIILGVCFLFLSACQNASPQGPTEEEKKELRKADHKLFHATLRKHLKATGDRDLETLKTMMAPDGLMHLMRPATEMVHSTDKYIKYHELWFADSKWNIETTITDSKVGTDMGMAVVDLMYREPERAGKPYWNKMLLSYTLKKYDDGQWYVISDHSTSVKKSTDKK